MSSSIADSTASVASVLSLISRPVTGTDPSLKSRHAGATDEDEASLLSTALAFTNIASGGKDTWQHVWQSHGDLAASQWGSVAETVRVISRSKSAQQQHVGGTCNGLQSLADASIVRSSSLHQFAEECADKPDTKHNSTSKRAVIRDDSILRGVVTNHMALTAFTAVCSEVSSAADVFQNGSETIPRTALLQALQLLDPTMPESKVSIWLEQHPDDYGADSLTWDQFKLALADMCSRYRALPLSRMQRANSEAMLTRKMNSVSRQKQLHYDRTQNSLIEYDTSTVHADSEGIGYDIARQADAKAALLDYDAMTRVPPHVVPAIDPSILVDHIKSEARRLRKERQAHEQFLSGGTLHAAHKHKLKLDKKSTRSSKGIHERLAKTELQVYQQSLTPAYCMSCVINSVTTGS
jgi:hypothetical protein